MTEDFRICTRCVMDTSDPDIIFDENGVCNHCKQAEDRLNSEPYCLPVKEKEKRLIKLVDEIKRSGKNKPYDCIIGLSGGVDSSYVAYKVKELGLRPLAVHLDNGWNSELSVQNIENICTKVNIDLYTWVLDWEEFKDLQLAFFEGIYT
jgi:Predicted ATPase of the PP-loop superfamily implicated in cell cycle control